MMRWPPSPFSTCIIALSAALLVACTQSEPGEGGNESVAGQVSDPVVEGRETRATTPDAPEQVRPASTPVELLTVDTGVSDDAPLAGETIQIYCTVGGLAEDQEAPATSWEIVLEPADSEAAPVIDGDLITFMTAGSYAVACQIDATSWTDPTPSLVQVSPAEAADIETVVTPTELTAGDTAMVTCHGTDAMGNPITEGWEVAVIPESSAGLEVDDFTLTAITVGSYEVACRESGGAQDSTPVEISVAHGLPYKLVTELESDIIEAGDQTTVTCRAEDAQGNLVPDFVFSLAPLSHVVFAGQDVTSTVAGTYVVKCVPGDLGEWSAYALESDLLEVVPGPPVSISLTLQPPKAFFATYELIQLVINALDEYDNHVADAPLAPLEVGPGDPDHHMPQDTAILFFEDGEYTVTARLAEDLDVSDTAVIAVDGAPPTVTVTSPLRGATVMNSKPSVTIEGFAADTVTGIDSVTVNGAEATIQPDGEWTKIIIPRWGLNVIEIVAVDGDGQSTEITQAFYFAEHYHPMDPTPDLVPDAIKGWMDDEFIDDGVHNPSQPDDLATILETVLVGLDLGGMLPGGIGIGAGYELQIKSVSIGAPTVSLDPVHGGMDLAIDLDGIHVGIKLKGECKLFGIDFCPDFGGSVHVSHAQMTGDLLLSAWKGDLDVGLENPHLDIDGLDVDISGILGWLFDWLIDFVVGLFADTIEDMLEDQINDLVGDTLTELIGALNITETLEIDPLLPGMSPISMTVEASIWNLAFAPDGGRFGLASRITTAKQVPQVIDGAIARGTCLKGYTATYQMPGETAFEAALYDDFMNQAVTAMWYTGAMNVTLGEDEMGELLGDGQGDVLPLPVDGMAVQATLLLPPILNGCKTDGIITVQIGDAFIDLTIDSPLFGPGDDGKLGAYISTEISAEVILTDKGDGKAVGILLQSIDDIAYHWEYVPELFQGNEEALEELIETQLLGDVLDELTQTPILDIEVPEIDLGALTPIVPAGTMITPVVESLVHVEGHTLLQGHLE